MTKKRPSRREAFADYHFGIMNEMYLYAAASARESGIGKDFEVEAAVLAASDFIERELLYCALKALEDAGITRIQLELMNPEQELWLFVSPVPFAAHYLLCGGISSGPKGRQ